MKALEWQDDEGNDRRLGVYEDSFLLEVWDRKAVTRYRISYNLLRKIVEWGAAAIFKHEQGDLLDDGATGCGCFIDQTEHDQ